MAVVGVVAAVVVSVAAAVVVSAAVAARVRIPSTCHATRRFVIGRRRLSEEQSIRCRYVLERDGPALSEDRAREVLVSE